MTPRPCPRRPELPLAATLLVALLAGTGCAGAQGAAAPPATAQAPGTPVAAGLEQGGALAADFELETTTGDRLWLASLLADGSTRLVLLDFWSTWCEPCKQELPFLEQLQRTFADEGLRVLAVAIDPPSNLAEVRSFVRSRRLSLTVPLDVDRRVVEQYDPGMVLPFWVLLDANRRVVRTHQGYLPGDEELLDGLIRSWLASHPAGTPPG